MSESAPLDLPPPDPPNRPEPPIPGATENRRVTAGRTRTRGRPFTPGQSGNPGGRPRLEGDVRALAQAAGPKAMQKLVSLLDAEEARVVLSAAIAILDRAIGKPGPALVVSEEAARTEHADFFAKIREAIRAAHGVPVKVEVAWQDTWQVGDARAHP